MENRDKHSQIVASECIGLRIRKLDRTINRLYDRQLAPFGITLAQFNLLAAIELLKEASPSALSKLLLVEKSSLSRNLERLSEQNWIEEKLSPTGRFQSVSLSAVGLATLLAAHAGWEDAQKKAEEILGGKLSKNIKSRIDSKEFSQIQNALLNT